MKIPILKCSENKIGVFLYYPMLIAFSLSATLFEAFGVVLHFTNDLI